MFRGSHAVYNELEIDDILKTFKEKAEDWRDTEAVCPYYEKSMGTLKYLMEEQNQDAKRFAKIQDLYKDVSLENTLKLLLRCKIAFENRRRLLAVFLCYGEWERQCSKLNRLFDLPSSSTTRKAPTPDEKGKLIE